MGKAESRQVIAYLSNAYPKVSHSFIRREIAALERQGVEVVRVSIRRTHEPLPDPADAAELERTIVLLDGPADLFGLLRSSAFAALTRGMRFAAAMRAAFAMARAGGPGLARNLAYLAEACRLAEIIKVHGATHVHAHFGTNPAAVARLTRLLTGIPYSFTAHGPDEFDSPQALSLAEKIADSAFTVGVSSFGRSQLMRWARLEDWPRIIVVRCGIDESFLNRPLMPIEGSQRLVCVARLSAQKGLPLLLEAAGRLANLGRSFELRLVGDGELRGDLEKEIQSRGLGRHVVITGWLGNADVRAEIEAARALVLPSFAEGLPVVIMEALALGRPVIATAIAGIPELVDQGCGWLVPAGSVDALAAAMAEALDAPLEELARRGEEGRSRVAAQHNIDTNAAQLLARLLPVEVSE